MSIVIAGIPMAKPRMTRQDKWLEGKAPYRMTPREKTRAALLRRYRDWATTVTQKAKGLPECQGELSVWFYLPIPASWPQRHREQVEGQPHQKKPDLSNLIKGLEDAIFKNDQMIHTYTDCRKLYDDGHGPRTVILV